MLSQRFFQAAASSACGAVSSLVGVKTLELTGAIESGSLSNLLLINTLGNFGLTMAIGTSLEIESLINIVKATAEKVISNDPNEGLSSPRNLGLYKFGVLASMGEFTFVQSLVGATAYALFLTCAKDSEVVTLSTQLASLTVGSALLGASVSLLSEKVVQKAKETTQSASSKLGKAAAIIIHTVCGELMKPRPAGP